MQYDDGEVLPGLDDEWTFMGANAMEWSAGLVMFFMISLFAETPARAMPFMLAGWVLTTTTLASLRNMFPDQQRGVRNVVMTACGFNPPGIPTPARLQPVWSPSPMRAIPEKCRFKSLGLEQLLPSFEEQYLPADEPELKVKGKV